MARPREFDEDVVLEKALHAFWLHGYEGTSLHDLIAACGLNKSSLYKAFGSKEGLFLKVVDLYHERYLSFREDALSESTPRQIVEKLLRGIVDLQSGEIMPPGCLITNSALVCSSSGESIRSMLILRRETFAPRLAERFRQLKFEGELPQGMDSNDAADFVGLLINGLAVQAKSGCGREKLDKMVSLSLLHWPQN